VPIDLVTEGHPTLQTAVLGIGGTSFAEARYEIVSSSDREVVQRATSRAGVLTRTLRLDESGYGFELALSFESRLERPVDALFEVRWPVGVSEREDFRELSLLAYSPDDGVSREMAMSVGQAGFFGRLIGKSSTGTQEVEGRAVWAGFDIRYFTGVLIDPEDEASLDVRFEMLEKAESAVAHVSPAPVALGAGGEASRTFRGFFGPKQSEALAAAGSGLEHTINRGWSWLEPLTHLFEIALDKLYAIIPNYGLAIIVLTILVRVLVSPLMVRQMRSAEKMRAVQPRVKALQEKYKDDRQKQSEEMMKLWREEGINPLGGCLPVFLQFPVLIGLFYALQSSIGLRHAPFVLWIDDLSQPATLFTVPGIEFPIRVLPLIMGASMFVQQKMTPTTGMDPAQARMMQIMMPGMMLLISYTFPSGLVLYWTVSNLLGIAHQYWIRNKMQPAT
ncbi:MAG: YidC/Oxa1 family insertase periplasmic-domain containing protein, partial [bacterium]